MIFLEKIKNKSIFSVVFTLVLIFCSREEVMCGATNDAGLSKELFEECCRQVGELTEEEARIVMQRLREEFPNEIVVPRLLVSLIIVFGLHLTLYLLYTYGHVILNSLQELPQQIYEFFSVNSRNIIMYQIQNMRNPEHLLRIMKIMSEVQQQTR